MNTYLLTYSGGEGMPQTEEEQASIMAAWTSWFDEIGDAVVDGGNPTSMVKTIAPDGAVSDGPAGTFVTGYSLLEADTLDEAVKMSKGCPVLSSGGSVSVYELIDTSGM
jgi:hypothetical protein